MFWSLIIPFLGLLHAGMQDQPCSQNAGWCGQMHAMVAAPSRPGHAALLSLWGKELQYQDPHNGSGCVQGNFCVSGWMSCIFLWKDQLYPMKVAIYLSNIIPTITFHSTAYLTARRPITPPACLLPPSDAATTRTWAWHRSASWGTRNILEHQWAA